MQVASNVAIAPGLQQELGCSPSTWLVNVRPELELLLCCVQVAPGAAVRARLEALLHTELDWGYLRQLAWNHGLMPILYQSLSRAVPELVPPAVLQQLESDFRGNVVRNLALVSELFTVLSLLAEHGIPAIPYKGPVLAASVYGNLALRQFRDLDILLHKQDAIPARDLLVAKGFRCRPSLNCAQEVAYLRDYAEFELGGGGKPILELHWRITESYFSVPLPIAELWERLQPVSLAGRELHTFAPEDLLLILCIHGTKHFWYRLAWVCDVARLIAAHPAINWTWIRQGAIRTRCVRMLRLGLVLACDLLGAAVPEAVQEEARADAVAGSLAAQVRDWLARDVQPDPLHWSALLLHLQARECWADRVRLCIRLLVTPTPGDWAFVRLPPAWTPLYYLLRPFRLIGHYALQKRPATQHEP